MINGNFGVFQITLCSFAIKFGKSKNLDTRHREYKEIFGENTNFKIILQISDYAKLVAFEKQLKEISMEEIEQELFNKDRNE